MKANIFRKVPYVIQMSHTLRNKTTGLTHKIEFKAGVEDGVCEVYLNGKLYDYSYNVDSAFNSYTRLSFWMNTEVIEEYIDPLTDKYYVARIRQLIDDTDL